MTGVALGLLMTASIPAVLIGAILSLVFAREWKLIVMSILTLPVFPWVFLAQLMPELFHFRFGDVFLILPAFATVIWPLQWFLITRNRFEVRE